MTDRADRKFISATLLPILLHEGGLGFHDTGSWQVYDREGRRKYLDRAERARFLTAADREPPAIRALCYLLLYCGCRVSEALSVRRDQIDVAGAAVLLKTLKRRRRVYRRVPLPVTVINQMLEASANEAEIWPVHRATAWRWIVKVMRSAQIEGPMACCRGARHGFAMHAAAHNVPPNLLQKWMGHASIETTAIYLDAAGCEEREFAQRMW